MTFDSGWKELKEANRGKKGTPYKYAESPILQAAAMRTITARPANPFRA